MLTLKDVAEKAGVSVSTVSLVLNGRDAGRIRPELSERVREIADALGYVPDLMARGLKTRRTHTIGLLSDQVASIPFAGQMLGGAQAVANHEGYLLLMIDTDGDRDLEKDAVTSLVQRNVEALIYASAYHREVDLPAVPDRIPLIVLDGLPVDPASRADWVVPDERGGAYAAVTALIEAGHRRIGFCNYHEDIPASRQRLEGYRDALESAGIAFDSTLVVEIEQSTTEAAREPARRLLFRSDRPSGVFCFGDQVAFGFYQVAEKLGLRVPDDLSVVGFDNQQYVADALHPGLTTVQLPHRAMGEWAVRTALERIRTPRSERGAPRTHRMICELVVRDSVAPPGAVVARTRQRDLRTAVV